MLDFQNPIHCIENQDGDSIQNPTPITNEDKDDESLKLRLGWSLKQ